MQIFFLAQRTKLGLTKQEKCGQLVWHLCKDEAIYESTHFRIINEFRWLVTRRRVYDACQAGFWCHTHMYFSPIRRSEDKLQERKIRWPHGDFWGQHRGGMRFHNMADYRDIEYGNIVPTSPGQTWVVLQ